MSRHPVDEVDDEQHQDHDNEGALDVHAMSACGSVISIG